MHRREANESAWSNPAHLSGGLRPFAPLRALYQAFQQLEPQFIRAVGKILVGKVRSVFLHLPYDLRQGCDPRSPHAPSESRKPHCASSAATTASIAEPTMFA